MIAVAGHRGFTCAEIGQRIPCLRSIGPERLLDLHSIGASRLQLIRPQSKRSHRRHEVTIPDLFIRLIIVEHPGDGSNVLVKGFVKIFVPLPLGSIRCGRVGTL